MCFCDQDIVLCVAGRGEGLGRYEVGVTRWRGIVQLADVSALWFGVRDMVYSR